MTNLSRRDQFAMAAMQFLSPHLDIPGSKPGAIVEAVIKLGDDLIAELDRTEPKPKCEHDTRSFLDGAWVCRDCGKKEEPSK